MLKFLELNQTTFQKIINSRNYLNRISAKIEDSEKLKFSNITYFGDIDNLRTRMIFMFK